MTPAEAAIRAAELNDAGKHREDWFYYPTYHSEQREWFVMRRLKNAPVRTAILTNGRTSITELNK